jgi:asparagine synthase (glutamine-hydrolysing)
MDLADRVPRPAAAVGARLLRTLPAARRERRSTAYRAVRFLEAAATPRAERYGRLMQVFSLAERAALWTDEAKSELGALASSGFLLGPPPRGGATGLQLLDIDTYLPGALLPKADIASMAHSLELRAPLLDRRVVELGLSLPARLKHRKRSLRRAFAAELPPLVAERGKTGFGIPLAAWFRSELRDLAHDVLLNDRGWFERDAVAALLEDHAAGRADNGHRLWTLVMLELWLRAHVDAPVRAAT